MLMQRSERKMLKNVQIAKRRTSRTKNKEEEKDED